MWSCQGPCAAQTWLAPRKSGSPISRAWFRRVSPPTPALASAAKEPLPNLAVLFTSGYTENAIVHGGRLDRGVELLGKPYSRDQLARKVRHVLGNQAQHRLAEQQSHSASAPLEASDATSQMRTV